MKAKAYFFATFLLSTASAQAQTSGPIEKRVGGVMQASKLAEFCSDGTSSAVRGVCGGYILGVVDSMSISLVAGGEFGGWKACFPDQMNAVDLIKVGKDRMKVLEPKYANLGAAGLVGQAMEQAYPCKK